MRQQQVSINECPRCDHRVGRIKHRRRRFQSTHGVALVDVPGSSPEVAGLCNQHYDLEMCCNRAPVPRNRVRYCRSRTTCSKRERGHVYGLHRLSRRKARCNRHCILERLEDTAHGADVYWDAHAADLTKAAVVRCASALVLGFQS